MCSRRVAAIRVLMNERQTDKITPTGLKRCRKAFKDLGLTLRESIELERILEFRNQEGQLYAHKGLDKLEYKQPKDKHYKEEQTNNAKNQTAGTL